MIYLALFIYQCISKVVSRHTLNLVAHIVLAFI